MMLIKQAQVEGGMGRGADSNEEVSETYTRPS